MKNNLTCCIADLGKVFLKSVIWQTALMAFIRHAATRSSVHSHCVYHWLSLFMRVETMDGYFWNDHTSEASHGEVHSWDGRETAACNECCRLTHHQHLEVWPRSHMQRHVLHRLDVSDQIKFRLCVTVYKCIPGYLSELCWAVSALEDVTCFLLVAAISTFLMSDVPLIENGHLPTLAHQFQFFDLS